MIRIGILGAARIAPKAVIHPASVRGDVIIQAVAARDLGRAKAFAEKYSERGQTIEAYEDYQAVVDHPGVDLVYNPLPINLHVEWTIKALEAGKHVLCEKPFAMNIQEAEAMLAAAEKSGKRVIEAFHYRYHPAVDVLLDWLAENIIGDVQSVRAVFNAPIPNTNGTEIRHLPETGGGAFMDLGCYPLSWMLDVINREISTIDASAELTPLGVDEKLSAKITFDNGMSAELSSSMAQDEPVVALLEIAGTQGNIKFENPLAPQWGAKLVAIGPGSQVLREAPPSAMTRKTTYSFMIDAVVDGLNNGTPLPTEGGVILRQQRLLDRIYEAAGLRHLRYR